jgi:carbon starvation protein
LLYSGDVASIWPLFGAANQLLAVVALAIGTTVILKLNPKKVYALIPGIPLAFLTVTVLAAGGMNVGMFYKRGDMLGNINGTVSIILIVLVVITLLDCIRLWIKLLNTEKPVGMNTEIEHACVYGETKPNIPS